MRALLAAWLPWMIVAVCALAVEPGCPCFHCAGQRGCVLCPVGCRVWQVRGVTAVYVPYAPRPCRTGMGTRVGSVVLAYVMGAGETCAAEVLVCLSGGL